jgi:hypothetical protein
MKRLFALTMLVAALGWVLAVRAQTFTTLHTFSQLCDQCPITANQDGAVLVEVPVMLSVCRIATVVAHGTNKGFRRSQPGQALQQALNIDGPKSAT